MWRKKIKYLKSVNKANKHNVTVCTWAHTFLCAKNSRKLIVLLTGRQSGSQTKTQHKCFSPYKTLISKITNFLRLKMFQVLAGNVMGIPRVHTENPKFP